MADPRNVAHDKKVQDEKKKHGEAVVPDASETPQPGKKPTLFRTIRRARYQQHAKLRPGDSPEE